MLEDDVRVDPLSARWILNNSVMIGPGVLLPERFVARVQGDGFEIEVEVVADIMGPRAHRVSVTEADEGGVSTELLRRAAVTSIVSAAAKQVVWVRDADGGGVLGPQLAEVPGEIRSQWPNGDLPVFLRWVGAIYLVADALGDGPTAAVGKAFGVSRATAGRYVEAARKARLLPPAERVNVRSATPEEKRKLYVELGVAPSIEEKDDGHFIIGFEGDGLLTWLDEPFSGWSTPEELRDADS